MRYIGKELTTEEVQREDELWHKRIVGLWGADIDAIPTEEESEAKRKMAEYMHEYYVTHRKKQPKALIMTKDAIRTRSYQATRRNRLCLFEGEQITFGTLVARLHKQGYSYHDAKLIADKALII